MGLAVQAQGMPVVPATRSVLDPSTAPKCHTHGILCSGLSFGVAVSLQLVWLCWQEGAVLSPGRRGLVSSRDGSQRAEALPGSSGWFFTTNRETACAAEGLSQGESEGIGLELESSGTASSLSHLHGLWGCGTVELLGRCSQGPGLAQAISGAWLLEVRWEGPVGAQESRKVPPALAGGMWPALRTVL